MQTTAATNDIIDNDSNKTCETHNNPNFDPYLFKKVCEFEDYTPNIVEEIRSSPEKAALLTERVSETQQFQFWLKNDDHLPEIPSSLELNERGNAKLIASTHGLDMRYCPDDGKVYIWDMVSWTKDDYKFDEYLDEVIEKLKIATENISSGDTKVDMKNNHYKETVHWVKQSTRYVVRKHTKQEFAQIREVGIRLEDFDRDPLDVGCQNGTIDLRKGEWRESRREDFISKRLGVLYDSKAECPSFKNFLDSVFIDDEGKPNQELIEYVLDWMRYSLTGLTKYQIFGLLHGEGSNGKTTLIETHQALLGEYGTATPFKTLLAKRNESESSNDLARMAGVRLVSSVEPNAHAALDESKIKVITGGDSISARFLYKEYFDYIPKFKLWLACNRKPKIKGTDDAIWSRVKVIPFNASFPRGTPKCDPDMKEKLIEELPGILNLLLEGMTKFLEEGFKEPDVVKLKTDEYRTSSDTLQDWLDENERDENMPYTISQGLYDEYYESMHNSKEYILPKKDWGVEMVAKGFKKKRIKVAVSFTMDHKPSPTELLQGSREVYSSKDGKTLTKMFIPPDQKPDYKKLTVYYGKDYSPKQEGSEE